MIGDPKSANALIRLGLARAEGSSVAIAPLGWALIAVVAFLAYRRWFR